MSIMDGMISHLILNLVMLFSCFVNDRNLTSTAFQMSDTVFQRFYIGPSLSGSVGEFRFYQSLLTSEHFKEL